jgi:hypothetical protein
MFSPVLTIAQTSDRGSATHDDARRRVRSVRLTGTIRVDGKLDDAAWATAPAAAEFMQMYPRPGAPPQDQTEVRVLYDDDAVYVGARMFDSRPDSIAAPLARRDPIPIYSDFLHVLFDSHHDRRSGFRFSVNPRGVKKDMLLSNDVVEDGNWDAVWDVETSIDSLGWVAEYRIPFSQLRFGRAGPGDRVWGFQVIRDIARRNERTTWSPWSMTDGSYVAKFGDIVGFADLAASHHAELMPYVAGRLTHAPDEPTNPFFEHNRRRTSIGVDLKSGLPGGLTLNATIKPDFGQVEVDPAVVNLSAYETFFPEKRPFFVEGAGIFNFGTVRTYNSYNVEQYFYSRRIGRAPQRLLAAPFVDAPDQTAITGAAKVSGRLGPWTVGVIDAITRRETALFASSDATVRGRAPVEPLTNFAVARLRRDINEGRTHLGAIFTATHRALGDTALRPLLRNSALTGGLDFEHGWSQRKYYVSGFLAGSRVSGSAAAIAATQRTSSHFYQRPDAGYLEFDPTRTSLEGYVGEIAFQRNGAFHASVDLKLTSPGLELNDLGFEGRADYKSLSTMVGYQSFTAGRHVRRFNVSAGQNAAVNFGNVLIANSSFLKGNAMLNNFWTLNATLSADGSVRSDRLTRGGPLARTAAAYNMTASIGSDTRRTVSSTLGGSYGWDDYGSQTASISASVVVRPTSSVRVSVAPSLNRSFAALQYLQSVGDSTAAVTFSRRYIFGTLRQTTVSAETRIEWTLTPLLSVQFYAQPFASAGHYGSFRELAAPASSGYPTYGVDRGTIVRDTTTRDYTVDPDDDGAAAPFRIVNPDFNVRSLRGNAVLRWEYRPGSQLYLVWQQRREGAGAFGHFNLAHDVRAIFQQRMTNMFAVKFTYWLGT